MVNLLEIIFEYQLLRAKAQSLEIPLDSGETSRLAGLERLLQGEGIGIDARRDMPRLPSPLAAEFTLPGGFGAGRVANVSGGGIAIVTDCPADLGARTIVRVSEPSYGAQYTFPARVVWCNRARRTVMGLSFEGVPSKAPFLTVDDTRPLRRRRLTPLVA